MTRVDPYAVQSMTTISPSSSNAAGLIAAATARQQVSEPESDGASSAQSAAADAAARRELTTYRPTGGGQPASSPSVRVTLRQVKPGYFMAYGPPAPSRPAAEEARPDADPGGEISQIEAIQRYRSKDPVDETGDQARPSTLDIVA